jgi:hypothetical protein
MANVAEADAQDLEQGFQALQQKNCRARASGPEAEMVLELLRRTRSRGVSPVSEALELLRHLGS